MGRGVAWRRQCWLCGWCGGRCGRCGVGTVKELHGENGPGLAQVRHAGIASAAQRVAQQREAEGAVGAEVADDFPGVVEYGHLHH